jgi:hypothetical protein
MSTGPKWRVPGLVVPLVLLTGCATGSLATSESTPSVSSAASASTTPPTGPTLIVTVPELLPAEETTAAPAPEPAPASASVQEPTVAPTTAPVEEGTEGPAADPEPPAETAPPAQEPAPAPAPAAQPEPAAPAGEGLNVSLANCDGCTVLATHRDVTGDLSAALVATPSSRAILLSVGPDGQVSGVVGVPYGAAFSAPDGGVLACAQARCVVVGRQSDGRAILSAFELTSSGAWRDISGDDAFPSATERAAVVDLGGELGIAVQDQGDGAAVWMLYTWGGDRYAVLGCSADGSAPTSTGAVSPERCLS